VRTGDKGRRFISSGSERTREFVEINTGLVKQGHALVRETPAGTLCIAFGRRSELIQRLADEEALYRAGFNDNELRVPRGNGRESGEWTSGIETGSGSSSPSSTRAERRGYTRDKRLPADAIVVKYPDGTPLEDSASPTGKLMAPPRANYQEVYAAGQAIANVHTPFDVPDIAAALDHGGKFDFQRDRSTRILNSNYVHASNYSVGVYMAGAGYSVADTIRISQGFSVFESSNHATDKEDQIAWTTRGWNDAHRDVWR
jgi:hypothetical protein